MTSAFDTCHDEGKDRTRQTFAEHSFEHMVFGLEEKKVDVLWFCHKQCRNSDYHKLQEV